jgi:hypothetical protein
MKYAYYSSGWQVETITTCYKLTMAGGNFNLGCIDDANPEIVFLAGKGATKNEIQVYRRRAPNTWGEIQDITSGSTYHNFSIAKVFNYIGNDYSTSKPHIIWNYGPWTDDTNFDTDLYYCDGRYWYDFPIWY